ncbi:Xaa-Pro dipeptidyl-peptidase [Nocardiopsis coralliicola]
MRPSPSAAPARSSTARGALRGGTAAALAAVTAASLCSPASADVLPGLTVQDGRTQPVFDYADAVYEEVDITTGADSDGDGEPDTVRLRLMRPGESGGAVKVATVLEPSPYWAGTHEPEMYEVDLDDDGAGTVPPRGGGPGRSGLTALAEGGAAGAQDTPDHLPNYYDNYFLPRGYAVAQLDSLGSGSSTGCPTSGGANETAGVEAAVDWLNGRTEGRTPGGEPVTAADWSTGDVAMTGISYNGTLPMAAATTGVEGLRTIVPQGAISSWYDYYRSGGAVTAPGGYQGEDADVLAEIVTTREGAEACGSVLDGVTEDQDRATGDRNRFWADRDYRDALGGVSASVFLAHGLNDDNVKTDQALRLWEALEETGVERRLWLHQGGHVDPMRLRMDAWLDRLHAWFDRELYGIGGGSDTPPVEVEGAGLAWSAEKEWPAEGAERVRLGAVPGGADGSGGLTEGRQRPPGAVEGFTDRGRTETAEELAADPGEGNGGALVYRTGPLPEDTRLSGVPEVAVRAAMDGASPHLTALLVDYGTDTRPTGGVAAGGEEVCYGAGVPDDPGCTVPLTHVTEESDFAIVTRGHLDARNRVSEWRQQPVVAGREYRYSWEMLAQDYVFKEGHRIGLVLISTDHGFTQRYPSGTEVAVDTADTSVTLPLA